MFVLQDAAGGFDVGLFPPRRSEIDHVPTGWWRFIAVYNSSISKHPAILKRGIKEQCAPVVISAHSPPSSSPRGVHLQPCLMETCLYGGVLTAPRLRAALYL